MCLTWTTNSSDESSLCSKPCVLHRNFTSLPSKTAVISCQDLAEGAEFVERVGVGLVCLNDEDVDGYFEP